ncbi:hypothetical protein KIH86_08435 [Paenibacillus sp. HN-1]|uniref:hypothetical protein n=1 Tax=Paenibacillus TaxID=44249 RepID=UPI000FB8ABE7|nr:MULTISPECIES: hypothetical protein [Paenibacillus]MBY9079577.1 hypothetical protein [Paenibacillus sp. CGMCC 1.18879]MBY9084266.1 hypothetical protein [Paenibacillus sinensis]
MKRLWTQTTRRLVILLFALLLAGAGVIIQNRIVSNRTEMVNIAVASENVQPNTPVKWKFRNVVKSEAPADAITDAKELEGQDWVVDEVGIPKDIPIGKSMLVKAQDSKYGPSATLGKGSMFVGVSTDQVRSAGDYIKPGVRVDAYVYVKNDAERTTTLITPGNDPLLKNLLIKDRQNQNGFEPKSEDNQNPIPAIAIIETDNPKVAAALIRYQEEGRVYLVPTGTEDNEQ